MWFYRPEFNDNGTRIEKLNRHVPGFKKRLGWYSWPNMASDQTWGNLERDKEVAAKNVRHNWNYYALHENC